MNCLNLECQNEQLKMLIEKLDIISNQREDLLKKTRNVKVFSSEIDSLYLKSLRVEGELRNAKERSLELERTISILRERITKIDGRLAR